MPKMTVFEKSRRELSLDVSVGVHILLFVEQSSLESQSRGLCQDSDTSYGNPISFRREWFRVRIARHPVLRALKYRVVDLTLILITDLGGGICFFTANIIFVK